MTKTTDPAKGEEELPPFEFKEVTEKDWPLCLYFGDTPTARTSNWFMAMPFYSYTVSDVSKHTKLSRQTAAKSIKVLVRFKLLKVLKKGKTTEYQWDEGSRTSQGLRSFLRTLIDTIVEEQLEYAKTHAPPPEFEVTEHDMRLILRGDYKGKLPEGHLIKIKKPEP